MISLKIVPAVLLFSCLSAETDQDASLLVTPEMNDYWYNGEAEITSFKLEQARYGEIHEGTAVMVFVTEHFSPLKYSKVDAPTKADVPVLKLNFTKKFNTGIYPYSMMTSTFFPFENGEHSIKVSSSSQEWCGHTYMELVNSKQFNISLSSYFEDETSSDIILDKAELEDDLWTQIRLNPKGLPVGELNVIPSFFFLRLMHAEVHTYKCTATNEAGDMNSVYTLNYPVLERELAITYETAFPYKILSWTETYQSGFGSDKKKLTTKATRIETIKSDYWSKHNNEHAPMRKQLGLD